MRNKIFGVIGVIWGALILVNGIFFRDGSGTDAYETGSIVALIFGACLFGAGLFYLLRKPSSEK